MLKIEIVIEDVSSLTDHEKSILAIIAGGVTTTAPVATPRVEEPKVEIKEETPKTRKPRTTTPKVEVKEEAPVEEVEDEEEVIEEEETNEVVTPEDLRDYAKDNADSAYGPAYAAILTKYKVKNFQSIPLDKVAEVKAQLDEVFANVPKA